MATSWGWEWGAHGCSASPKQHPELVQHGVLSRHVGPAEQAHTEAPNCPAAPREEGGPSRFRGGTFLGRRIPGEAGKRPARASCSPESPEVCVVVVVGSLSLV